MFNCDTRILLLTVAIAIFTALLLYYIFIRKENYELIKVHHVVMNPDDFEDTIADFKDSITLGGNNDENQRISSLADIAYMMGINLDNYNDDYESDDHMRGGADKVIDPKDRERMEQNIKTIRENPDPLVARMNQNTFPIYNEGYSKYFHERFLHDYLNKLTNPNSQAVFWYSDHENTCYIASYLNMFSLMLSGKYVVDDTNQLKDARKVRERDSLYKANKQFQSVSVAETMLKHNMAATIQGRELIPMSCDQVLQNHISVINMYRISKEGSAYNHRQEGIPIDYMKYYVRSTMTGFCINIGNTHYVAAVVLGGRLVIEVNGGAFSSSDNRMMTYQTYFNQASREYPNMRIDNRYKNIKFWSSIEDYIAFNNETRTYGGSPCSCIDFVCIDSRDSEYEEPIFDIYKPLGMNYRSYYLDSAFSLYLTSYLYYFIIMNPDYIVKAGYANLDNKIRRQEPNVNLIGYSYSSHFWNKETEKLDKDGNPITISIPFDRQELFNEGISQMTHIILSGWVHNGTVKYNISDNLSNPYNGLNECYQTIQKFVNVRNNIGKLLTSANTISEIMRKIDNNFQIGIKNINNEAINRLKIMFPIILYNVCQILPKEVNLFGTDFVNGITINNNKVNIFKNAIDSVKPALVDLLTFISAKFQELANSFPSDESQRPDISKIQSKARTIYNNPVITSTIEYGKTSLEMITNLPQNISQEFDEVNNKIKEYIKNIYDTILTGVNFKTNASEHPRTFRDFYSVLCGMINKLVGSINQLSINQVNKSLGKSGETNLSCLFTQQILTKPQCDQYTQSYIDYINSVCEPHSQLLNDIPYSENTDNINRMLAVSNTIVENIDTMSKPQQIELIQLLFKICCLIDLKTKTQQFESDKTNYTTYMNNLKTAVGHLYSDNADKESFKKLDLSINPEKIISSSIGRIKTITTSINDKLNELSKLDTGNYKQALDTERDNITKVLTKLKQVKDNQQEEDPNLLELKDKNDFVRQFVAILIKSMSGINNRKELRCSKDEKDKLTGYTNEKGEYVKGIAERTRMPEADLNYRLNYIESRDGFLMFPEYNMKEVHNGENLDMLLKIFIPETYMETVADKPQLRDQFINFVKEFFINYACKTRLVDLSPEAELYYNLIISSLWDIFINNNQ